MKKSIKIIFLVLSATLILGLVAVGIAFAIGGSSLYESDADFVDKEHSADLNGVTDIVFQLENGGVTILPSPDSNIKFEYKESDYSKASFTLNNGKLTMNRADTRKFWHPQLNFAKEQSYRVTAYVPVSFGGNIGVTTGNGAIEIKRGGEIIKMHLSTSNGAINIENMTVTGIAAHTSNGETKILNVTANDIGIDTSNGKVTAENLTVNALDIKTSNGTIDLKAVTAGRIKAKTSNGTILFSGKITTVGGADFKTSNGRVAVALSGNAADYYIKYETSNGKVTVAGIETDDDGEYNKENKDSCIPVFIDTSNGGITIVFAE